MNTETIKGSIERVIYSNEQAGFAICSFNSPDREGSFTITGNFLNPSENDELQISGIWQEHPKFGKQFKVENYIVNMPTSEIGIVAYLGSGLLPGIGPATSKKIVSVFGENIFDILDTSPDKLISIPGITEKKIEKIKEVWQTQRGVHLVMSTLMGYGITTAYAIKIYKKYGAQALQTIQENPFVLCRDIAGIGFRKADEIGVAMGFDVEHPLRIQSGVLFALSEKNLTGHVYCPYDELIESANEILSVGRGKILEAIEQLQSQEDIIIDPSEGKPVYTRMMYHYESKVAQYLSELNSGKTFNFDDNKINAGISKLEQKSNIRLAEQQKNAVESACKNMVSIISGGPGTGKTTIISAICEVISGSSKKVIMMAAPTGRAAKRMSESTGYEAKTIHRLLEYQDNGFTRNKENPLEGDVFIIDESSMIDTALMYFFLNAVPDHGQVVFVGDIHQLPSVGPGNVLRSMIDSQKIVVVHLNKIFRQAKGSGISRAAHEINNGIVPALLCYQDDRDFIFVHCESNEIIQDRVIRLAKGIPDSQVLSPMRKGDLGIIKLNELLQAKINPNKPEKLSPNSFASYAIGDRVLQLKNNYDNDVFNGDTGTIINISKDDQDLAVDFGDEKIVVYKFTDLDQISLAYAITIHKSQGSEYPTVIIPMTTSFYIMLARNLVYTGITRGKQRVVLVGSRKALEMAVKNDRVAQRYTKLHELI